MGNFADEDAAKVEKERVVGAEVEGDPKVQAGPIALRQIVAISPG